MGEGSAGNAEGGTSSERATDRRLLFLPQSCIADKPRNPDEATSSAKLRGAPVIKFPDASGGIVVPSEMVESAALSELIEVVPAFSKMTLSLDTFWIKFSRRSSPAAVAAPPEGE